jgi:hypothetical protein
LLLFNKLISFFPDYKHSVLLTLMNYFEGFEANDYEYDDLFNYQENFEILTSHMGWSETERAQQWQELFDDVRLNELPDLGNFSEPEYFDYFRKFFGFMIWPDDTKTKFNELAEYMEWNVGTKEFMKTCLCWDCVAYDNTYDYFYHVYEHHFPHDFDASDFFGYFKLVFDYDNEKEFDKMRKFRQLKRFIGLRHSKEDENKKTKGKGKGKGKGKSEDERKVYDDKIIYWLHGLFYQHIGKYVDEHFDEKFETLRDIILNYGLLSEWEIKEDIEWCKQFIEDNLFANIFDFASENYLKFETLDELSHYSIENRKIFPLEQAKETFAYRVLLREIFSVLDDVEEIYTGKHFDEADGYVNSNNYRYDDLCDIPIYHKHDDYY